MRFKFNFGLYNFLCLIKQSFYHNKFHYFKYYRHYQAYGDGMTLAYMEKIFSKYSFQGGKARKSRRRKKNHHKKEVLAKGLDPVETIGKQI